MPESEKQPQVPLDIDADNKAIRHLKKAIAEGKHWYIALLEAMRFWPLAEEARNGRIYRYLIGGEAFDWLLLAERLCEAVDNLVPQDELANLLFFGKPPLELTKQEFAKLIGNDKYQAYLNYLYGITVEEALILVVEGEVRKEWHASGHSGEDGFVNEVYRRIYGEPNEILLERFRKEKGYPLRRSIDFIELKEFTYWLFKYRVERNDKTRVASDTKKGLAELGRQRAMRD
jgi:hypothetical protein